MRKRRTWTASTRLCIAATLSLSLLFGVSCRQKPLVLTDNDRIFQVKHANPVFGERIYSWHEVEGWYVIAPANLRAYLVWMAEKKAEEEREDVP